MQCLMKANMEQLFYESAHMEIWQRRFYYLHGKLLFQRLLFLETAAFWKKKLVFLKNPFKDYIKKQALAQVIYCEFCAIFKNTCFTEHLCATAYVDVFELVVKHQKQSSGDVLLKRCCQKFRKNHRKTPVPESLF